MSVNCLPLHALKPKYRYTPQGVLEVDMALRWQAPFAMLAHSVADTGWLLKKAAVACLLPWLQFACRKMESQVHTRGGSAAKQITHRAQDAA